MLNRRELLAGAGAALTLGALPFAWTAAQQPQPRKKKKLLMYTRSEGFQHSVVARQGNKLSLAENLVTELGKKHGFEAVCEKDGRIFLSREFPSFDGFVFMTQGNLLAEKCKDGSPPMTLDGKKALLKAIEDGKGFVGCHCASDTFHSPDHYRGGQFKNQQGKDIDPYIQMLGGEFIRHGRQQKAWMRVTDSNFPAARGLKDFNLHEEWYSLKNFAPDLHVILIQDTKGMVDFDYERPPFPATWARMHGKGPVFYTSMGHREDVWQHEIFQKLLVGAIHWAVGNIEFKPTANIDKVTPQARTLPMKK